MSTRRTQIAYVLKAYPRLSEMFILREIQLVERAGLDLRIISLKDERGGLADHEAAGVKAQVTFLPEHPASDEAGLARWMRLNLGRYLRSNLRVAARHPLRYVRVFLYALFSLGIHMHLDRGPSMKRAALKDFLRGGALADEVLRSPQVGHLHAHFCHGSTTMTMLAAHLVDLPYSFTAHAKDIYLPKLNPGGLLQTKIARAAFVVTCTGANGEHLQRLRPRAKIHTIHHGLDPAAFAPPTQPRPDGEDAVILSVGRHVDKKGFPTLVDACGLLHDRGVPFSLVIVGSPGEATAAIEARVAALGLEPQVRLEPSMPQASLTEEYQRCTVVALACEVAANGDRDGIPNVLMEAMATAAPVVSTRVSGIPELIHHEENGLLVDPHDASALADALELVLGDRGRRAALGAGARRTVEERFDSRRTTQPLIELLRGQLDQTALETGDSEGPFEELCDEASVGRVLNDRLFTGVNEGEVLDCRVNRTRYRWYRKPRKRHLAWMSVSYEVDVRNAAGARSTQIVLIRARRDGRSAEEAAAAAISIGDGCVGRVAHLPELDATAWLFPHDPALPSLPAAFSAEAVTLRLPFEHIETLAGPESVNEVSVTLAHYYPEQRCSAVYRVNPRVGTPVCLFGKVFRPDFDVAAMAVPQLAGEQRFRTPRFLGADAELSMCWFEYVEHVGLVDELEGSKARVRAEDTGRCLAGLHRSMAPVKATLSPRRQFDEIATKLDKLAAALPQVQGSVEDLLCRLEIGLPEPELRSSHGDFHLRQVGVAAAGELVLFDFDEMVLADPARDVAGFVVSLGCDPAPASDWRRHAGSFLDGYREVADSEWLDSLEWQVRFQLATKAYRALRGRRSDLDAYATQLMSDAGAADVMDRYGLNREWSRVRR